MFLPNCSSAGASLVLHGMTGQTAAGYIVARWSTLRALWLRVADAEQQPSNNGQGCSTGSIRKTPPAIAARPVRSGR